MKKSYRAFLFVTLAALVVMSTAPAQDDPFNPTKASDKKEAKQPEKQPPAKDDDPFGQNLKKKEEKEGEKKAKEPATAKRIDFDVKVEPSKARRGETVKLIIAGTLRSSFHTYPIAQSIPNDSGLAPLTVLTYEDNPDLKPLTPLTETKAEVETVKGVGNLLVYKKPFVWSQDVLILPDAKPGLKQLRFKITLQVCGDEHSPPGERNCVLGTHKFSVDITADDAPAVQLTADIQKRLATKEPAPTNPAPTTPAADPKSSSGLIGLLIASMGAAIAMLFTPCVFPMIPITVSFFLKQSEKEHHNALATAGVYSLTIIVVLALSVLVLGELIVKLANDAWLNLGLGALLIFFAFSLFGMYEIELPSSLARFTSSHEGKGGYVGAMFMSLTFTVTSFTCTGPFLGPLLVAVKEYKLSLAERALGAGVYATTFAAPFFVLALFPSLLKKLPKSGGWLNAVKVVMGFLELAAALKFVANTDLAWNPGNPMLFNYETVLCAWIALALLCGFYLLGMFQLPHDSPVDHLSVGRMILASIFLGLAIYMIPALWRITPQGIIGKGLVAFLPLDTRAPSVDTRGGGGAELTWTRDYQQAWDVAVKEGKLIFIDFTGQNCTNCRYNEKNVFPLPVVHQELTKYIRVQLYTDFVPDAKLTASEAKEHAVRNRNLQSGTFGDITNPLYAVIKPDKSQPIEDGGQDGFPKLKGEILGVRKGLIAEGDVKDFETFLSAPLKQHVASQGQNLQWRGNLDKGLGNAAVEGKLRRLDSVR